jgi:NADH-quinone oxidoreductase subunit L
VQELIKHLALLILLTPLLGCLIAGFGGKRIGKAGAHGSTILLMIISFVTACVVFKLVVLDGHSFTGKIYTWAISGSFQFNIGFMIDRLTAIMMLVVTFVSLVVHIYTIGYMADDPGYQRFFCYVSLFTFAMLLLVTADNFLQLFIGWEGVGLVSYLLIGFWFNKESAAAGSLKAFIVNRVGDFGFLLGIAAILDYVGSINYDQVFTKATALSQATITIFPGHPWSLMTVICVLLFIGAMGKSAQIPLHVWLPESMEGPTPISALIHAATMVTAGVFMVARMSPLFELSQTALSLVLVLGATGGLFLGLLAFVENDIKRVIAYSTMSQLGYMMAANGVSAYSAGIFHLLTHACFKALLFLSAGSVIIAMHHEQDLRKMGGLRKYLPVTYITFLIGALALSAIPPFAGFYSKDAIIEAVHLATIPGATYSYWCLLIGSFVTAFYIFRAFFLCFHTNERMDDHVKAHLKEYWIMLVPLILLAIPSTIIGALWVKNMLYANPTWFGNSITILAQHNVMAKLAAEFKGVVPYTLHAVKTLPFWFAFSGLIVAWVTCVLAPSIPKFLQEKLKWINFILVEKYGFDRFNDVVLVRGTRALSNFFYRFTDVVLIDDLMVNGSGRGVSRASAILRRLQSGFLYHYVLVMILGVLVFLLWMVL